MEDEVQPEATAATASEPECRWARVRTGSRAVHRWPHNWRLQKPPRLDRHLPRRPLRKRPRVNGLPGRTGLHVPPVSHVVITAETTADRIVQNLVENGGNITGPADQTAVQIVAVTEAWPRGPGSRSPRRWASRRPPSV